ncbi:MAG: DUF1844 domain-containing protein [Planctomycetota bacterium]|nr:DUF1844 domain-containing protein [Planctomycetota bacterium]
MAPDETPEIQVDSDWKAQAQAEKEKMAAAEQANTDAPPRGLPPADFKGLMSILASQAMMGLGMVQDPGGKGVMVDLEGSKFAIDLLDVLQKKTAGNLEESEEKELTQLLTELRSRFVQITQLIAQQAAGGEPLPGDQTAPGEGPSGSSPIITP